MATVRILAHRLLFLPTGPVFAEHPGLSLRREDASAKVPGACCG